MHCTKLRRTISDSRSSRAVAALTADYETSGFHFKSPYVSNPTLNFACARRTRTPCCPTDHVARSSRMDRRWASTFVEQDRFKPPTFLNTITSRIQGGTRWMVNTSVVVGGVLVFGYLMYTVGSELFGESSSTTVFRELLDRVKADERVGALVGVPIRGTVDHTSRARTVKTVNHHIVQDPVTGQQKMIVRFYLQGPKSTGTVHGELLPDQSGAHWVPYYLYVDVPGQGLPSERIVVEDHRPPPPKKEERKKRGLFSFDSSQPVHVPLSKQPPAPSPAAPPAPEPDTLTRITDSLTTARDFILGQFAGQPLPPPPPELVDAAKRAADTAKDGLTDVAKWARTVVGKEPQEPPPPPPSPPPVPRERTWAEYFGFAAPPEHVQTPIVKAEVGSKGGSVGEVGGVWRTLMGAIEGKK
ncbi:TIM21-domain-containing protein [Gonapodya prolifera JEL478]|uniref:Mitochondrial import inner membrane translocase subunit TIM21 n=1 Tax=Gonapodya prolifera (strain JEL478) TaxID=1344416 RepID=A0A139AY89_GONPJ|nr:TIM21-domain-containing protein [Gonapodya prolifera JEL478]|eukprot:KXS21712.1 TIM21-domain-containing protein [Gonapodya prolifera JEL478]